MQVKGAMRSLQSPCFLKKITGMPFVIKKTQTKHILLVAYITFFFRNQSKD
jgi:hypothetical protein